MKVVKDTVVAGSTIFTKITENEKKKQTPGESRSPRRAPTQEEIEKVNTRNAEKTLAIILNHNFCHGDYHLVLTYKNDPSKEEAKKFLKEFKRKMTNKYKKNGTILKWITVTEYKNGKIHHHMVCSQGMSVQEITETWGHGFIFPRVLDETGDYRRLASYLIKETNKTFRDPDSPNKHRYDPSKSIERPEVRRQEVSKKNLDNLKPVEGYYIDKESIRESRDPFTGKRYVEYVMISLTHQPRIAKWKRGKKIKMRTRKYKDLECQLELMIQAM